jgi:hypothetical protein
VTFLGDEIRKGVSIIIEVWITSLNSHHWLYRPQYRIWWGIQMRWSVD